MDEEGEDEEAKYTERTTIVKPVYLELSGVAVKFQHDYHVYQ